MIEKKGVPMKVGIIGYGLSGRIFHGAILETMNEFTVATIYTRSNKETAQNDFPQADIIEDPLKIINDPSIELVIICTPNTSHFKFAKAALENKKHVVVEKPFTVTAHDALLLMDLAKENNLILSVYHNRRFDGDFLTLKRIIEDEDLGRLVELESHFDRFRSFFKDNWREKDLPGSGILYDLGSHLIDQSLDLFGLPNEVYGHLLSQRNGQTDDAFEIIMYYDALTVTLKAGMLVKEGLPRFIAHGTKGSYIKYGMDPQEERLKEGQRPGKDWGYEDIKNYGCLNTHSRIKIATEAGDYRKYYKNIYAAINGQEKLIVTAKHGFNVIRIIEAVNHSHQEKRRIPIKH